MSSQIYRFPAISYPTLSYLNVAFIDVSNPNNNSKYLALTLSINAGYTRRRVAKKLVYDTSGIRSISYPVQLTVNTFVHFLCIIRQQSSFISHFTRLWFEVVHSTYAEMGDWNLQDWKMTDHQKTGGGIWRTGKWQTKSQGWNLQDWKMTD